MHLSRKGEGRIPEEDCGIRISVLKKDIHALYHREVAELLKGTE
jgi:hypothetical protein